MTPGRRSRILQVLYSFRVGGSEVVGLELAQRLSQAGFEVLCASLDGMNGPLRTRCENMSIPVVDLGIPQKNIMGRNGISLTLTRRLASLNLDAIHLQHFVALNKLGLPARLARIPRIVVTEHSEAQLRESPAGRLRLRINWRLAHCVTVIHDGLRRYLVEELGVPPTRITVIPNGIDIDHWQTTDRDEHRGHLGLGSEFTFAFVGRLVEVKNVPNLIGAFLKAAACASCPMRLLVVGGGPTMEQCKALLRTSPLGSTVTLTGEQADTRRFLAAADAFVLNSHSEGVPRALLEAMSMGLPCIATAVGGIPALLQGRGWLTPPNDTEALVSAFLEAAADPVSSRAKGAEGRSLIVNRFNLVAVLERYQEVLLAHQSRHGGTKAAPRDDEPKPL